MHSLGPYGNHVYSGSELSGDDQVAARKLLKRLNNTVDISGLDSLKMTFDLPSGATAVATNAGGIVRLIIVPKEKDSGNKDIGGFATDIIPMLFSGVIRHGFAPPDKPIRVEFTDQTLRRLAMYGDGEEQAGKDPVIGGPVYNAPKSAEMMRFNVRLPPHLAEFGGMSGLAPVVSQYARTRPTWWTGAMATVVQVVGGYGHQVLSKLPREPLEQVTFMPPYAVMERIRAELSGVRLPGYSGRPNPFGWFQYDYKFLRTNAVTFDGDGKPFLVEVCKEGVYVMPLPIVPATATKAFREYIEEVGDHEILYLLDKFGGLPSGETFPLEREAWERAGVVIKVCDTDKFYELDSINPFCGWAFNESGTEGFNTGTHKGPDVPYCSAYKIRLSVKAIEKEDRGYEHGWSRPQPEIAKHRDRLDPYIRGLYSALSFETPEDRSRSAAIQYKIRQVPIDDLMSRAGLSESSGAADVDFWDNYEVPPIAKAEGSCSQVSDGPIYFYGHAQFKIPDPLYEGCTSHSVTGLYDLKVPEPGEYPRCDTVIYGYYIKDQLKVVKYFYDPRELDITVDTDFEDCMTVGNWYKKILSSPARISGNLYTSDFDDREEVAEGYTLIEVEGTDLGYPSKASMSFVAYFWRPAQITRNRYFARVTKTTRVSARVKQMYCYTPFMMRNGLVYGYYDRHEKETYEEEGVRGSVSDPNYYRAWTYDWSWNWAAYDMDTSWMAYDMPLKGDKAKAPPNPFVVETEEYSSNAGPCSDWADSGSFEGLGVRNKYLFNDDGKRVLLSNPEKPPAYKEYKIKEHDVEPKEEHGNFADIHTSTKKLSNKAVGHHHFDIAPDKFMNVLQQQGTRIEAGNKEYSVITDTGGKGPGVTEMGGTALADNKTIPQFIGVINE